MELSNNEKLERAQKEMVALETAAKALLDAYEATRFTWDTLTLCVKELALSRKTGGTKLSDY
jgi:hypothetical protein